MSPAIRVLCLLVSLTSLGAGLFWASSHPLAPSVVLVIFVGSIVLFSWHPRLAIFLVPVLLPILNFAPWTGWLIVDEFDLLILAVLAAGYIQILRDGYEFPNGRTFLFLLALVVLLVAYSTNGLSLAELSAYSAYTMPLNGFRVGKSVLWTLLLTPLVAKASQSLSTNKSVAWFFSSCLLGCCAVVLAVLWERSFFPGLFDISTPYRTVALFWEMHLGGAALDAYLVLLAPLLVWAWREATSLRARLAVGALVVLFTYVCLTTFSRGVFGAIAGSLVVLAVLFVLRRLKGVSAALLVRMSSVALLFLVLAEVLLVLGTDSFMSKRLATSEQDFGGRWRHWEQGVGLLKSPVEWLFGIGLGQLPARLTTDPAGPALPGAFYWHEDDLGRPSMVIEGASGTYDGHALGRFFSLSQRVDLIPKQRYHLSLDLRSDAEVALLAQVCAEHLLYPARCQFRKIRLSSGDWQHRESVLMGYPFRFGSWEGLGRGVFSISVLTPGVKVEVRNLMLTAGEGNLLRNPQFEDKEAGWFPNAHSYFLPWHIDNLYLELLIETGIAGLLSFVAGVFWVVRRLFRVLLQGNAHAPYFIASIAGLLALGLVVSVMDMSRVASLLGLFLVFAWQSAHTETAVKIPSPAQPPP